MSLALAFKGPEGIVLASDSRVTLSGETPQGERFEASYDNATKLFDVAGQDYVGVVTYGAGAFGVPNPRTVNSYLPELEESLKGEERLSVQSFAEHVGQFFLEQWKDTMPDSTEASVMFLIGGYDEGEPYGRVYKVEVPNNPEPVEQNPGHGSFGITWGGQLRFTSRLISGFEPALIELTRQFLDISEDKARKLQGHLQRHLATRIPYQFLPLQDCVDLSELLVRTTIQLQNYVAGTRGVGGPVDIAVVTRKDGFRAVRRKQVVENPDGVKQQRSGGDEDA